MTPLSPFRTWTLLPEGAPLLQRLLAAVVIAGIGTILFLRLHALIRRLEGRVEARLKERLPSLHLGPLELLSSQGLFGVLHRLVWLGSLVFQVILAYVLLSVAFGLFPRTQGFAGRLLYTLLQVLQHFGLALLDYLPRGLVLIVLVLGTRLVLGVLRPLFDNLAKGTSPRQGFDPEWAKPTYTLVRLGVLAFALILAVPYLPGSGSDAFKAVSLFVGVLVSLGSSGTIGNFISGVMLTYMRAYRRGDVVKLGEYTGIVQDTSLVITRLHTFKNEEVVLSNANVLGGPIHNFSRHLGTEGLLLHTTVTIGYGTPWQQVEGLLVEAARRTRLIEAEPAPFVLQTALGDFFITYELNPTTRHPERLPWIYSELHQHIQDTFAEAGVEILSPHYTQLRDGHDPALPPGHGPHAAVPGFRLRPEEP